VPPPQGGALDLVEWELSGYLDGGSIVPVPAGVEATATFGLGFVDLGGGDQDPLSSGSGSITGLTDCHSYLADVEVDEPELSITNLTVTIGPCDSPAAEVEAALLAHLLGASAYTATAETLEMYGDEGDLLLAFVAGTPTASPSPSPAAAATPTPTPSGRQARITQIRVREGRYVVDYEVFGYRQQLPGRHVHFYFDSVPSRQAGVPGSGPWILYAGPSPFTEYRVSDRPAGASRMCILVANPDHSIITGTGNCVDLPR
jgi:hypothetical protein